MRAAPLPDNLKPVHPGMEGGRYRLLSDDDVLKIHRTCISVHFPRRLPSAHRILRNGRLDCG